MAAGISITEDKIKFVQDYWKYAVRAAAPYGHDPEFVLAHGVAERGWKGSPLSKEANNFFGYTTGSTWKGDVYPIWMAKLGKTMYFRKYPTLQGGFDDYLWLIYNPESYYTKVRKQGSIEDFAYDISQSRYITETNGDNREAYRKNILSAYYIIHQIRKPFVPNWLLISVLSLAAMGGAAWYVWKYEPKVVKKVKLLLTT